MSDLTGLNLDANVAENLGSKTIVPAGDYKIVLVGDELKPNSAGTGKILNLKIQIIEGQFIQTVLEDNLNITNPSQVCQAIGQGTLKRICNLCKVPYPPQNTGGLMGKPMVATVVVEEFNTKEGNKAKSNKIKAYKPADSPVSQATLEQPQTGQNDFNSGAQPTEPRQW